MKVSLFSRGSLGLSIAGLALVLSAGSANASDSLRDFTFVGVANSLNNIVISTDAGINTEITWAGLYDGKLEKTIGHDDMQAYKILCTDARHNINFNQSYDTLVALGKVTDKIDTLSGIGKLYNETYNNKWYYEDGFGTGTGLASALNTGTPSDSNPLDYLPINTTTSLTAAQRANEVAYIADQLLNPANSYTQAQQAAGQLAIWDITQDGGDGLTTGNFQASGANVTSIASLVSGYSTSWETLALAYENSTNQFTYWVQSGRDNKTDNSPTADHLQDFVFRSSAPIPEASTLIGFGSLIGIGGIGLLHNKRTRK